jgi:translation elongation factor EF-Tu-like GTPase
MEAVVMFEAKVSFLRAARRQPPRGVKGPPMYHPHVVVDDSEYMGMQIELPSEVQFETEYVLRMYPLYKQVDYSVLREGVRFSIMEGAKKVGDGIVVSIVASELDYVVNVQK